MGWQTIDQDRLLAVVPAQVGIRLRFLPQSNMDPRLRGDDGGGALLIDTAD